MIDGDGGVLLPGLHDHHIHLFALAARDDSFWCGPPDVTGAQSLIDALREASRARRDRDWLRGVGWDDTVIGWPDRHDLDRAVADRPIRLQHRSGALWVLNSAALARLDLDLDPDPPPGLERDEAGAPTGRLFGADAWLAARLGGGPPDLAPIGRTLAAHGVTGVTDATAHNGVTELDELARQHRGGRLPQRITAMTAPLRRACARTASPSARSRSCWPSGTCRTAGTWCTPSGPPMTPPDRSPSTPPAT